MATIELQPQARVVVDGNDSVDDLPERLSSNTTQNLEPADQGLSAWKVLLAASVFEAVLWGFPLSFGVFQQYYSSLPQFADSPFIAYIGSITTGITYLGAPLMAPMVKRFPQYQRHMVFLGWLICLVSLIVGSFADSIAGLALTQGVLYGIGYLIIFYPLVSIMNEWWVTRRGFAWGILLGASGIAGVAYPFIIEAVLHEYGYKTGLRAMAVATIILTGPLMPFVKCRLPPSRATILRKTDWSFSLKPLFWLYLLSTITQSLGFYLPSLHLPAYASASGINTRIGALLLALLNIASVFGQLVYGYLSDRRLSLEILLLSTTIITAISTFTLWGLAQSVGFLLIFALTYGFFAYAYLALRPRIGNAVSSDSNDNMTMFCIFSFGQGIGNILAGPVSGFLLANDINMHEYGYVRYKPLIIFTGVSMVASAACVSLSYLVPARYRLQR